MALKIIFWLGLVFDLIVILLPHFITGMGAMGDVDFGHGSTLWEALPPKGKLIVLGIDLLFALESAVVGYFAYRAPRRKG